MTTMRAVQISRPGGDFELVEREVPVPAARQVRIKVEACGVCHSDVAVKEGVFPWLEYPRVPGHEVVGIVDEVGADVSAWRVGQRVGVGWHGGHCFVCEACRDGDFMTCANPRVTGILFDGSYAEYMVAPQEGLALVPDALTSVEAAPLLCAGITCFNALRHSGARADDVVAVQGVGGLGHLGLQYAKKLGFKTVALSGGGKKRDLAQALGADVYIDTSVEDPAEALQTLGGAQVILATAPDGPSMSGLLNGLKRSGTLLVVGIGLEPVKVSTWDLIVHRRNILGWPNGTARDSEETMAFSVLSGVKSQRLKRRQVNGRNFSSKAGCRGVRADDGQRRALPCGARDRLVLTSRKEIQMLTKIVSPRVWLYVSILLLVALTACAKPVTQPPPPDLPDNLETGWNRIAPAGQTVCANGSEYAFFVDPGTVNKLVVDFDGGGACWNDGTCSQPSNPENEFGGVYVDGVYGSPADFGFGGIFDRENPANPFRDWYHVYISYCTADLHLGDNVASYTGPDGELKVNHKGAANTRAALGWIFDNFSAPETVFVTGLSAGAYASIVWLPEIAKAYPRARVVQLGDSGAGVVTEDFFTGDAANWQVEDALPDLSEPVVLDEDALTNLYTAVGRYYPDAVLSQYNSLFDGTQIGFYGLMQGISPPTQELSLEWSQKMTASLAAISGETDNFRSYLSALDVDNNPANGTTHVILNRPEFYTLETDGVRFVDWLSDLVNGRSVESVSPPAPQGEL